MTKLESRLQEWHQNFLKRLDERPAPSPAVPGGLPAQRLQKAQVLFIGAGKVGAAALKALRELPLQRIRAQGLREQDIAVLRAAMAPGADYRCARTELLSRCFEPHLTALQLQDVDLIAVALSRPQPRLMQEINRLALRHRLPLCPVVLEGSALELGPTVLAGAGACLHCTEVRLASNAGRPDVWAAQQQFWDANPDFELAGRHAGQERQAGLWLALELRRLLGGDLHGPLSLSRIRRQDFAYGLEAEHFVPYYEWCPHCQAAPSPERQSEGFADFIATQRLRATRIQEQV